MEGSYYALFSVFPINITHRFQVVPKTSENINPRKEGAVFSRESASPFLIECFSFFLMPSGTDIHLFLYDLKAARNIQINIKMEMALPNKVSPVDSYGMNLPF
jgi:hypothetical protein